MLGIYLPMLVVEPRLTYRCGRVQESPRKALSKGCLLYTSRCV